MEYKRTNIYCLSFQEAPSSRGHGLMSVACLLGYFALQTRGVDLIILIVETLRILLEKYLPQFS